MAHFAEIGSDNTVVRVLVVPNAQEHRGHDFLANELGLGGTWIQTSYNTYAGVHRQKKQPLRKNYAGIGYTYDAQRDAFIPPKEFASWVLNEDKCIWEAPVPRPNDGKRYNWNEATTSWTEVTS